jgi:hypothetical protein
MVAGELSNSEVDDESGSVSELHQKQIQPDKSYRTPFLQHNKNNPKKILNPNQNIVAGEPSEKDNTVRILLTAKKHQDT